MSPSLPKLAMFAYQCSSLRSHFLDFGSTTAGHSYHEKQFKEELHWTLETMNYGTQSRSKTREPQSGWCVGVVWEQWILASSGKFSFWFLSLTNFSCWEACNLTAFGSGSGGGGLVKSIPLTLVRDFLKKHLKHT